MTKAGVTSAIYALYSNAKGHPKRIKMLDKLRKKIFKK